AAAIARAALIPSREAFASSEVVLKGAGGGSRCWLNSMRATVADSPPSPASATTAWAPSRSQNGPPTAAASRVGDPDLRTTFQKVRGTKSSPLRGQLRPPAPKGIQRLHADEFPFPIIVRREDYFVRRVGKEPQDVVQRRGRFVSDRFQVDQIVQVGRFPILDVRRIVDLHDMPAEREKGVLVPLS